MLSIGTLFLLLLSNKHVVLLLLSKSTWGVGVKDHMLVLMSKSTCCCYCFCLSSVMTVMAPHCVHTSSFVFCLKISLPVCPLAIVWLLKKSFICGIQADTGWQSSKVRKKIALFGERQRQNRWEMEIQLSSNIQKYGENGIFSLILQVFLLLRLLTTLYYKIDNLVGLNLKDLKI